MERQSKDEAAARRWVEWSRGMFALWVLACAASVAAAADPDLVFDVRPAQDHAAADEPVVVEVTVANPGRHPRTLLRWWLPDGISGDSLFDVTRDGVPVPYVGRLVKRAAPTPGDYVAFAPGERRRYLVDLSRDYDFSAGGEYTVAFDTGLLNLDRSGAGGAAVAKSATTGAARLRVEARPAYRPSPFRAKAVIGSNSFNECTVSEQNSLIAARSAADDYVILSRDYLDANKTGIRYTTWFGSFDPNRYSRVSNNFTKVGTAIQTASPIQFDCTCTESFFAYVYKNQPYVIYLCNAFWAAAMTGTDSKAGTLIHEVSHFTVSGDTDDHAYGHTAAKNLAISNPALAVDNADSHEYFSENTPVQEVGVPEAPTALAAQAGNGAASVAFQPAYHGGAAITNYQYSTNNGPWTAFAPADTTSPVAISGLTNGVPVSFRLRAVNAVGPGAASAASNQVTPGAAAAADLAVVIDRLAPGTLRLHEGLAGDPASATWRVRATNQRPGFVDGVVLEVRTAGALSSVDWTCGTSVGSCSVSAGTGTVAATAPLGAGQVATVELIADVAASGFAELYARARLPEGVTPIVAGEASASLIEAATASGVHRSGFE